MERPDYFFHDTVFACGLDDEAMIRFPRAWAPPVEALITSEYAGDECLMARLGLLPVIAALAGDQEQVSVGVLREWDRDAVETVLNLVVDGLLPDQPHLAGELAEFRAQRQLRDVEMGMPATVVRV